MAEEADLILSDDLLVFLLYLNFFFLYLKFRIDKNDENGINESPQEIALRQKRKKLIKGLNAILKKPLPKSNSTDFSLTALQPAKKLNFKAKKRSVSFYFLKKIFNFYYFLEKINKNFFW